MTRRAPLALLTAVALLVGLAAGCTVAQDGQVVDDGPGPSDFGGLAQDAWPSPGPRAPGSNERAVVEDFLRVMVGGEEGQGQSRIEVAKSFLTPEARTSWTPRTELNVIRRLDDILPIGPNENGNGYEVQVSMQQLGVLQADGAVDQPTLSLTTYKFNVERVPGTNDSGFFIANPPPDLLLDDEALKAYYALTPVYFWNQQGSALVPDLRYLALTTAPETRASKLVTWLTDGPSRWLKKAVQGLPADTNAPDLVTRDETGAYVVNLSAAADTVQGGPGRLHTQLAWTLRSLSDDPQKLRVKLRIASEDKPAPGDYSQGSLASQQVEDPSRYAVVAGVVYRVKSDSVADNTRLPEVEALRSAVAAVAFSKDERAAAVVRHNAGNPASLRLWIGPVEGIQDTGVTGATMSQPVWLDKDDKNALLLIDGALYQAGKSGNVQQVLWQSPGLPTPISSFTVAPDGRRIALISGGKLSTGVLQRSGSSTESSISVGSDLRTIPTPLRDLQQVAFTQENRLAIAGELNGKVSLAEITVDGAVVTPIAVEYAGSLKITRLVSYPDNPLNGNAQGPILFEINNIGYEAFPRTSPRELDANDLIGLPTPTPSASASPSGSPPPPAAITVTAPSFQG